MKKFFFCLVALATMALVSCQDKDETGPADAFVGNYSVTTEATFHNVPVIGDYSQTISDMDATIEKTGDGNDVKVTMSNQSTVGYVNSAGLHVDPIVITWSIMNTDVDVTVTFPVIKAPVDGTTSWVSNIQATVMGVGIAGTANMTAVKK